MTCPRCQGSGWLCEVHDQPHPQDGCTETGVPCPSCTAEPAPAPTPTPPLADDWQSFVDAMPTPTDTAERASIEVEWTFFGKTPTEISTAAELVELDAQLKASDGWAFRGHGDADRGLQTDFECACRRHGVTDRAGIVRAEQLLLREFGRKAHLYISEVGALPDPEDTLDWLSLMRHHGAPTRLLDWTYSIFVAAYFALSSSESDGDCSIWAIDTAWLDRVASKMIPTLEKNKSDLDKSGAHFRKHFMADSPALFVSTANPMRLNRQLALQRGVFLCPGDVSKPFVDNLAAVQHYARDQVLGESTDHSRHVLVKQAARQEIEALLYRLNIDHELLSPGIDGLARALRDRVPHLASASNTKVLDPSWVGAAPKPQDTPARDAADDGSDGTS